MSCDSTLSNESVVSSQKNVQTYGVIYNAVGYGLYYPQGHEGFLFKKIETGSGSLTASHVMGTGDEAAGS